MYFSLTGGCSEFFYWILVDNLREVLEATAEVKIQWKQLGLALDLDRTKLEEISEIYPSILQSHYHLMRYWITDIGASWGALVRALRKEVLNQKTLADKIETGTLIIVLISEVYV